ncbi:SET and MYND domain-containing protein (SMYD)-like protein [Leptotrombidium deliense]|uniref:Protein-lysine N-methyltransferase SMYD4 n=1 Tax=Leptotrombidium deliense TaxID=299467 RepID=A0A443STL4_9ACAR|nr:SET and MYND domain-containing protein (SMYD)-like protein [Leptotrombidium deliense]
MDSNSFLREIISCKEWLRKQLISSSENYDEFDCEWSLFATWSSTLFNKGLKNKCKQAKVLFKESFSSLTTNKERVRLIFANSEFYKVIDDYKNLILSDIHNESKKCAKKSNAFSCIAKWNFEKKQYVDALKFFTKAIFYAPFPDDCNTNNEKHPFLLALANRCETFHKLQCYRNCLLDAEDALKYDFDPLKRKTLEILRKECLSKINFKDICNDFIDENIEHKSAVRIGYSESKGRLLISNEALEKSSVVVEDFPFVSWLRPSLYDEYCNYCLLPLNNRSYPCERCNLVTYCSSVCSEKSWSTYHKLECDYLHVFKFFSIGQMAVRIVMMTGIEKLIEMETKCTSDLSHWANGNFCNDYLSIASLVGHENKISYEYMCTFTCAAILLAQLLKDVFKVDFDTCVVASIVLKLMMIIKTNAFTITDDKLSEHCEATTSGNETNIGHGLYALPSLFSHSCDPNCYQYFKGSKIRILTTKRVEAGEEVTISYGPSFRVCSYEERQKKLENTFCFRCFCSYCELEAK